MPRRKRRKPPDGLVTETTLRGMIRTIARKLKDPNLTPEQMVAMLKQQQRLGKQLEKSAKARRELEIELEVQRMAEARDSKKVDSSPINGQ